MRGAHQRPTANLADSRLANGGNVNLMGEYVGIDLTPTALHVSLCVSITIRLPQTALKCIFAIRYWLFR